MNSQLIERHLDVDTLPAAIPMRWADPHTRKYARASLRRVISFVEQHTGETYDWDACRAMMEKHNDEVRNEMEKWNFMATPYTAAALAVPSTVPYLLLCVLRRPESRGHEDREKGHAHP